MDQNEQNTEQSVKQNRFKSWAAWVALFALLGFILGNWGLFDTLGLTDETWKTLTGLILAAGAAFGILNNPTDRENF